VLFDVGHGRGSFSFRVARGALQQGFPPDTISSDIHAFNIDGPVYDLPTTMSKFLNLGVSLPEVIAWTTGAPAEAIGMGATLGSLRVGAAADIAVFELQEGNFRFVDCHQTYVEGSQRLVCRASLRAGRLWYNSLSEELM
jgi:dihydroorotase